MGDGSMLEGVLEGIEQGWFQRRIAESAFREQERYEAGDLVKVGVTDFVDANEAPIDTLVIGEETERDQVGGRPAHARRPGRGGRGGGPARPEGGGDHRRQPDGAAPGVRPGPVHGGGDRLALGSVFGTYRETPAF